MENKDLVILGGGPAGLSAAIYAARYGLNAILISRDIGGAANLAHKIENYPGYEGSGFKLMQKFYKQAKNYGAEFLNDDIIDIKKLKEGFVITTSSKKFYNVKAVILALGTQRRKLNVPGEDKFLGRGVSYCATCDGAFFRNKAVAVIGGGDSACKAALLLSDLAKRVYMICRGEKEKCDYFSTKAIRGKRNIEILYDTIPLEIKGKGAVSELIVDREANKRKHDEINPIHEERIKVDGVFIEIGSLPLSDIAKLLKMRIDKEEYVHVDNEMRTNVKGVFAAGDIVKSRLKQVVTSAAQGAIAAKSAYDYIRGK